MKKKPSPAAPRFRLVKEVSAGGLVRGPEGLLLVKVENLQGAVVWTFPKGHLEKGETAAQAALREVEEETGWRCRIVRPFGQARYKFTHGGKLIDKTVRWFLMEPLEKKGESDPDEILDSRWFSPAEADDLLIYKSDKELMARLKRI